MKASDLFLRFLCRHGAVFFYLSSYYSDKCNRSLSDFFNCAKPELYVSSAFFWLLTPQGADYWGLLHSAWLKDLSQWQEQAGKAGGRRRRRRR